MVIPKRGHAQYAALLLLLGNVALWWRKLCKSNNCPTTWNEFCHLLREQLWPENYSHCGRDELAVLYQHSKESVADFIFRFHATCLKIVDLSEAEKLHCFVWALVPNIRLQVELRGPMDFHKAAVFTDRAHAMISQIPGQESWEHWQQKNKSGP